VNDLPDPMLFIFGAGHIGQCVANPHETWSGLRCSMIESSIQQGAIPFCHEVCVGSWMRCSACFL